MHHLAATLLGIDPQTWIGVVIGAAVSIGVAYLIYLRQKRPRTLDYTGGDLLSLAADEEVFPGVKLDVSWSPGGTEDDSWLEPLSLKEAQIASYRIQNTGKRAIKADDFQEPLTVRAPEGRLIDCVVTEVSHPGVCDLGSVDVPCDGPRTEDTVCFTPALLNPGDWIKINVLTDGLEGDVELTCWIVDESRPMKYRQRIS